MARYIDADKLISEYDRVHIGAPGGARKLMVDALTADVVPKSEVAKIFEEIENEINKELKNNKKVLPQIEISDVLWNRVSGRINALLGMRDFIAELKKKYTEDQT